VLSLAVRMGPKLVSEPLALRHFVEMVVPKRTKLVVQRVIVKLANGHLGALDNPNVLPLALSHEPMFEPELTRLLNVVVPTQPVLASNTDKQTPVLVKIAHVTGLLGVALLPVETLA